MRPKRAPVPEQASAPRPGGGSMRSPRSAARSPRTDERQRGKQVVGCLEIGRACGESVDNIRRVKKRPIRNDAGFNNKRIPTQYTKKDAPSGKEISPDGASRYFIFR